MSGVAIRRAAPADARAIAAVHVASWRAAYRGIVPDAVLDGLSVERRERGWRARLDVSEGAASFMLVAARDGAVVGFCAVAAPSRDEDARESTAEVAAIYVDPVAWRSGVGAALLGAALEDVRAGGFVEATLWVLEDNTGGRAFYERFGFAPDGAAHELEELGARELRMRAAL